MMKVERFNQVFEETVELCRGVLIDKAAQYASSHDRLHNFKQAGALQKIQPERALAGMLAKHIVSVFDMVSDKGFSPAQWNEKIIDSINYLILLRALIWERIETKDGAVE